MELYLDSADINEIEEAFKLGFLTGLTTTPTFMHRGGVTDVDGLIVKLSKMVPILQIEALGDTAEEVLAEAKRQLDLGLDPKKTVFKIPVSLEGVRACYLLRKEGLLVNVHLIYTLQQAYMAMQAGATYVCPLVGRLQDQGHDALSLVEQCVFAVDHYGYDTKVMFSSVRNAEHVRNALNIGVHTITVPWKIMKQLTENNFTTLGTEQFIEHTRLMTVKVKDAISDINPTVLADTPLMDAIVKMTEYGFGAVTVVNKDGSLVGVFTDGDLRRKIQAEGRDVLKKKMSDFTYGTPISVDANALLNDASALFKKTSVDTILVTDNGMPVGMLDIQDLKADISR
jgi:transaldolase